MLIILGQRPASLRGRSRRQGLSGRGRVGRRAGDPGSKYHGLPSETTRVGSAGEKNGPLFPGRGMCVCVGVCVLVCVFSL
jgi:hypothetical protein